MMGQLQVMKKLQSEGILDLEAIEGEIMDEEDLELLPRGLNSQLRDLERLLEAADVDYEPAKKFDLGPIKQLYSDREVLEATGILLKRHNQERKKLLRQLAKMMEMSEEEVETALG